MSVEAESSVAKGPRSLCEQYFNINTKLVAECIQEWRVHIEAKHEMGSMRSQSDSGLFRCSGCFERFLAGMLLNPCSPD